MAVTYPADWHSRAMLRAKIREQQRERAEAEAARQGRSIKCGVDKRHADQVDGCQNNGRTCLCGCHDKEPGNA